MTWGEFKAWVEWHGTVSDETPIWYIDFSFDADRLSFDGTEMYIE